METKLNITTEPHHDAKLLLGDVFKNGSFFKFRGYTMTIYGCACEITDDGVVNYIRDNLTRWSVNKEMVERTGEFISEEIFISRVIDNARQSQEKIPTQDEIKSALEVFKDNFDCDFSDVLSALNIA